MELCVRFIVQVFVQLKKCYVPAIQSTRTDVKVSLVVTIEQQMTREGSAQTILIVQYFVTKPKKYVQLGSTKQDAKNLMFVFE